MKNNRSSQFIPNKNSFHIDSIFGTILILYVVLGLFFHGYLMETSFLLSTAILFFAAAFSLRWMKLSWNSNEIWIFGILATYALSALFALNKQDAWYSVIQWSLLVPVAMFSSQLNASSYRMFVNRFIWIGYVTVLFCLIIYVFSGGRFAGPFEYANGWALWMLVILVLTVALSQRKELLNYEGVIYHVMIVGIGLSQSRTVIVLTVLAILAISVLYKSYTSQLLRLYAAGILGVLCLACYYVFNELFWITIILAQLTLIGIRNMNLGHHSRKIVIFLLSLLSVGTALGFYELYIHRLRLTGGKLTEWSSRLGYYRDALKLWSNSPWIGHGGGSWKDLQFEVQTASYNVRFLHSHIMQMSVEVGVIGAGLFAAWIGWLGYYGWKSWKQEPDKKERLWTVSLGLCLILMLIHSTVDLSFSYPLLLVLFVFIAQGINLTQKREFKLTNLQVGIRGGWQLGSILLLGVALFVTSLGFSEAFLNRANGLQAAKAPDNEVLAALAHSRKFEPWASKPWELEARLRGTYNSIHPADFDPNGAVNAILQAINLNPTNLQMQLLYSQLLDQKGEQLKALQILTELAIKYPFKYEFIEELNKRDVIRASINGKEPFLINGAIYRNGTVMLPIRSYPKELAIVDDYDNVSRRLTIFRSKQTVVFTIGETNYRANNVPKSTGQPPILIGGRAYVPLLAVADALKFTSTWNSETKLVHFDLISN